MALPFHPVTTAWFQRTLGQPTDVQLRAWPTIAAGGHVLVTAPTGTGKTLAAFLVGLDRLLAGPWPSGGLRLLYVSPLKALNNDIRRNLLTPLAELRRDFEAAGHLPPAIEVMVRSGDTPEDERRRLRRRPPEILITTPESLNILLTQKGSAALFAGLEAVIVDEIHAVVGSKRGTALLVALERLADVAGEFQRIGLSATVNPVERVAQALGGFDSAGARQVTLVASPASKAYDVRVVLAEKNPDPETGKVYWESLALDLRKRVRERDSTLIFTNSRRSCEKLARLMNENQDELVAYSHHGSLSKEIRLEVESRLKDGELRALVATNSLELGIDIGDLDEVILAQTPRTASSAIQKVGRAGHRTGEVSRARLYPSHGVDFVEAAVILRCIRDQTVEPVVIPEGPLDVLAQSLLSMLCPQAATDDELFGLVRRAWPYRNLDRRVFDLVMDQLAGRYEGTRLTELKPRIHRGEDGLWRAAENVAFLLYSSGGTIPDRGYFALRDRRTGAPLGELDEEFVWERALGDRFALGAQVWKITAMNEQAVEVEPVDAPPHIIPFWKAEEQDRSWFLAEKLGLFLQEADRALDENQAAWKQRLVAEGFEGEAADRLVTALLRQKTAVGALPHRYRLVIERVMAAGGGAADRPEADQYVLHTFWGARLNRPWAFALAQAWEDRYGYALETYPGDDQILILVPPEAGLDEALALVTPEALEGLLRRRLETTGYFGARFREGAGRALLLPRAGFGKRMPLWHSRMKAKRLFDAVSRYPDFPIVLEAWRQCLKDEFDLEALRDRLDEVASGRIEVFRYQTVTPSPFTEGLLWRQVNAKMYDDDQPTSRRGASVGDDLWTSLLAEERPAILRANQADWEARWNRTAPGYAPETEAEAEDLLEVRIALTEAEWDDVGRAVIRDHGGGSARWWPEVPVVRRGGLVLHPRVAEGWNQPEGLWPRWLEGRGPVSVASMALGWGQSIGRVEAWVHDEVAARRCVAGLLTEGATETEVCRTDVWESLVRRQKRARTQAAVRRPVEELPGFLAQWQGLVEPAAGTAVLKARVGQLLGLSLPAGHWESVVVPVRSPATGSADWDRLFTDEGLSWYGTGTKQIALGFPDDAPAWVPQALSPDDAPEDLFGPAASSTLPDLAARTGLSTAALTARLWNLAWKGAASTTTWGPVRHGLQSDFAFDPGTEPGRSGRGLQRWSAARSSAGTWTPWRPPSSPADPVARLESTRRLARQALDRYGILFRSLLSRELPAFQWRNLFPALRLMELSGEVVGGLFWDGLAELQFALPEALAARETPAVAGLCWLQHAQDPSSVCGLGLGGQSRLPRRSEGTWLWWQASTLVAVVSGQGRRWELLEPSWGTEPGFADLLRRQSEVFWRSGALRWTLEEIDGVPAAESPQAGIFTAAGFQIHGDKLLLWKR